MDPIAKLLDDLLDIKDILACMVARHNMVSIMPLKNSFKTEVENIWDIIPQAMNDVFSVINIYSQKGLDEIEFKLLDFEVFFYVFPDTESALVVIVLASVNKGLVEVEIENARREILNILKEQEKIKSITNNA